MGTGAGNRQGREQVPGGEGLSHGNARQCNKQEHGKESKRAGRVMKDRAARGKTWRARKIGMIGMRVNEKGEAGKEGKD